MTNHEPSNEENFEDLFVDKNLLNVFKEEPIILANRFNAITTAIVCASLIAFSIFRFEHRDHIAPPSFVATFALWASLGWTLSATLLGFLIAGFALLCTVLRPSAVIALHQYTIGQGKKNLLRNLFVSFVGLFISYLALLIFSVGMVIVTSPNGPSLEIREFFLRLGAQGPTIVGYIVLVGWGTWFVIVALKLKSFIYNLYQSLMIGMAESAQAAVECANIVSDQNRPAPKE